MTSEYLKRVIEGPKNYEELNSSRPTKKRVFNYTMPEQKPIEFMKNQERTKIKDKDFCFDQYESSFGKNPKTEKSRSSPFAKKQDSPTKEFSKRCDIDHRLNNISSINDKISGLLSIVRTKRDIIKEGIKPSWNVFQALTVKKSDQKAFQSSKLEIDYQENNEEILREKIRQSLRQKYKVPIEQNDVSEQRFLNCRSKEKQSIFRSEGIDSSDVVEFMKQSSRQKDKQNDIKISTFSFKGQMKPLKETQTNLRIQNEEKQKKIIENLVLDRQIDDIKQKIFENSPFNPKSSYQKSSKEQIVDVLSSKMSKQRQKSEVFKLAEALTKLIEVDKEMFKYRQSFQVLKDQKKWINLTSELHTFNIYLEEKDINDFVRISIHEKDPFKINKAEYSLNAIKDLAHFFSKSEKIWNEELHQCVSLDALAEDDFSMSQIDFNCKGTICLEDLVCFVNVNSGKFYRSREVAKLFDRFLKIQGKTLDKDLSGGIMYSTLMEKVSRRSNDDQY